MFALFTPWHWPYVYKWTKIGWSDSVTARTSFVCCSPYVYKWTKIGWSDSVTARISFVCCSPYVYKWTKIGWSDSVTARTSFVCCSPYVYKWTKIGWSDSVTARTSFVCCWVLSDSSYSSEAKLLLDCLLYGLSVLFAGLCKMSKTLVPCLRLQGFFPTCLCTPCFIPFWKYGFVDK